jgi:hypothetical protein
MSRPIFVERALLCDRPQTGGYSREDRVEAAVLSRNLSSAIFTTIGRKLKE